MSNIRGTYDSLSRYYMREARSCFDAKAYRMTIVSAFTAVHVGSYFKLLLEKTYTQDNRIAKFNDIFQKIKSNNKFSDMVCDLQWLMNARNAVVHPDEGFIPELISDNSSLGIIKIKEKIPDTTDIKKIVFNSSIVDDLNLFRKIAKKSIEKAENVLDKCGFIIEIGNVDDWKQEKEKRLSKILGKPIDLEILDIDEIK